MFDVSILLGVADDDSGALFAEHASLFGLGTPVPAFLATEKTEHARGFLCTWSLYKHRALVSHIGPRPSLVEDYLYATAHAGTTLRTSLAVVHWT